MAAKFALPKIIRNYVAGRYADKLTKLYDCINPATSKVICKVQESSHLDVESAIKSAKGAFTKWSKLSGSQRGSVLHKTAALLREHKYELALLESIDQGKCISESLAVDIESAAEAFDYYGAVAVDCLQGKTIPLPSLGQHNLAYTLREPLGVVAAIGAWNYPLQIAAWKTATALACGCTVVYKPSELTPVTTSFLGPLLKEAGLCDGAFNVVNGHAAVGELLSRHKDIAKVSFTGSVKTGAAIAKAAADTFKILTLEMGGKSPLIIFPDCDIDNSVSAAMMANFFTQGEICSNGTRIFVHSDIEKKFLDKFVLRTNQLMVGDPLDMKTQELF